MQLIQEVTPLAGPRLDIAAVANLVRSRGVNADALALVADIFTPVAAGTADMRTTNASAYLATHLGWVGQAPGQRAISVTLTSTQASRGDGMTQNPGVISVATGIVQGDGIRVAGSLEQTFSDRRTPSGQGFDATRPDRLGIELRRSSEGNSRAEVTLIAESWGGGRQQLRELAVRGGVLVGTGDAVGGTVPSALFTVALSRFEVPG